MISAVGSYHGKTMGSLSARRARSVPQAVRPAAAWFCACALWGRRRRRRALRRADRRSHHRADSGEGGIRIPPDDYLPRLRELCDRYNAVLIVDEVQTGLGRTGTLWGVRACGCASRYRDACQVARRRRDADRLLLGRRRALGRNVRREPAAAHQHLRRERTRLRCRAGDAGGHRTGRAGGERAARRRETAARGCAKCKPSTPTSSKRCAGAG
jgi:hypothetical protein